MDELVALKLKYRDEYMQDCEGASKYIWQYSRLYPRWKKFLKRFKNEKILDFGSGPGFALKVGRELGLDITGLDIDVDPVYNDINEQLGVSRILYDGKRIPLFEDKFDVIIFHWSFIFDFSEFNHMGTRRLSEEGFNERVQQLKDITKKGGWWYISPLHHFREVQKNATGVNLKFFRLSLSGK
jgi:SAM-dependent methyltransferase